MRLLFGVSCVVVGLAIVASTNPAAGGSGDPKYTVKEVMQKAHKGDLLKKVTGDTATEQEKKTLLEMYESLTKAKVTKGDEASWKMKTEALVAGAKLVVDGKKDEGVAALKAATKCMDCHNVHKGKAK